MWTNEEINRLKSQHGHGWSVEESADILERSPLDVRNKLIALGLKPIEETTPAPEKAVKKRIRKITESTKESVVALRHNEYTLHDIARTTGISLTSVKRILKDNGLTNPPKIQAVKPADTKPAENWVLGQLENISNLMKNVKDVKEIGYALGRLDMLITVLKEDERRNNAR